ncbi:hypothetical protein L210DRAFT_3545134 [Boletus edulis BED1]|uniref:RRM domain-containing protein n=1 Tax=Boletus edulis BED1 TaxID=1328754 RepID=A0AAD4BS26_BOLED|nr:hypothetical protein L210DRAFT_3545134 [Boletus edulis BED1]
MNRDTHPDALNQITLSALGLKASVTTCGQFRKSQGRHKEPAMHPATPEKNKVSQEGLCRGTEKNNFHLRSVPSTVNHRPLRLNGDPRRNLYVLGLPFDITKFEFAKIFEPYGTVTHAVILATLDSASRRRGFIVMSTHEEAKAAMDTLSRTQIKGHVLDVSWAVVQRSQGFLDGADRSMMLAISIPSIPEREGVVPFPSGPEDQINNHWELTHIPTSKLMVSNLSTILFTQVSDLHPLFYPFGPIKDIKILGSSHVGPLDTTITAMVEYVNVSNAQEAKEALQCQSYAGHPIKARYICDAGTPTHTQPSPFLSGSLFGHGKSSDIGLNPFAIPFNVASRFSTASQICSPHYSAAISSGLPASDATHVPQPFPAHMQPYMTDSISRSSSATSSTWSHDSRSFRPARTSHSSLNLNRANAYTSYA